MKQAITACSVGWLVAHGGGVATANPMELGGWLGPRLFSDNSRLGQRDVATPGKLTSALELGGRVGWPMLQGQLVPELEVAFASTQTDPFAVGVLWLEPRFSLRYQLRTKQRIRPFALIGGGLPISLSGNTDVFANHVLGEGFVGGGVVFWTGKGFALRVDARMTMLPGEDPKVAIEGELGVGVVIPLGSATTGASTARVATDAADRDGDGIPDRSDACADRAEDLDGFEDQDGCPDIDNDLDHVLDIADACALQPETYNGLNDDDGCPDTLGPELEAIIGPIANTSFAPAASAPQRSGAATAAFDRIAKALATNPTVRIRLIGHTDDREAVPDVTLEGEEAPDPAALATELGLARAAAIRELLVTRGIAEDRVALESRGADDPAVDNSTPSGRQGNRRVELQLVIPER